VDASVVYIRPLVQPVADVDLEALERVCRLVFGHKRKVPFLVLPISCSDFILFSLFLLISILILLLLIYLFIFYILLYYLYYLYFIGL
jgi:hypothetical protein